MCSYRGPTLQQHKVVKPPLLQHIMLLPAAQSRHNQWYRMRMLLRSTVKECRGQ